jgi:hypothetical protein
MRKGNGKSTSDPIPVAEMKTEAQHYYPMLKDQHLDDPSPNVI